MRKQRLEHGFSIMELVVVLAILVVCVGVAILSVNQAVRSTHIQTAYQMAIMQLRAARQLAIDQRVVAVVTFTAPRTIHTQMIKGGATTTVVDLDLPSDIAFDAETGLPNTAATTPDGFGIGKNAIDFDQGFSATPGTVVYFYPDGSAQDAAGNFNNGVVYIAVPGNLNSSRAVTLFGATGRVRGWQLTSTSTGTLLWQ